MAASSIGARASWWTLQLHTLLGKQFDIKRRNPKHSSSALYAHFTGAVRHPGRDEGNITIYWFDHGWFWAFRWPTAPPVLAPWSPRITVEVGPSRSMIFFFDTIAMYRAGR
jgi:hypothetical protein